MKWKNLALMVLMSSALVACGGSGGSSDSEPVIDDPTPPVAIVETLRIADVEPSAAVAGDEVIVTYEGEGTPQIVLGGSNVVGTPAGSGSISFIVPVGAETGPLYIKVADLVSNRILFSISSASVVTPTAEDIVIDEDGNSVAVNQVLVSLFEEFDSLAEAYRIASLVGGTVVGQIPLLDAYQILLDSKDLAELEAYILTIEADSAVDFVMKNMIIEDDSVDWSKDEDYLFQRDTNQVEEGAEEYLANVHPSSSGKIRPVFTAVGVIESNVDFDVVDFDGYAKGRSNNIEIYAKDGDADSESHGTIVTGMIAAELGDGSMAGLLQSITGAHGGFNIVVDRSSEKGWSYSSYASTNRALDAGAQVVNWSFGVHKTGAKRSNGEDVDQNKWSADSFTPYLKAAKKMVKKAGEDFPKALIICTAGNGDTNAGDEIFRAPSSIVSENLLVVGAHTAEETPKREWYSNYSSRVDIASCGSVNGHDGVKTQGTSFAAPLVTATVAAILSIDPDISPKEIKSLLRSTALPIENAVPIEGADPDVFTAPLTSEEVGDDVTRLNKGARLNVKAAIAAAIERRDSKTIPEGTPVELVLGEADVTKSVSVTLPDGNIYDKVDILFLVDVSGSYGDDLSQFQSQATDLIGAFKSGGSNVEIGVASFSDFPVGSFGDESIGDYAYLLDQPLTSDTNAVIAAINALSLKSGADWQESQLEALYQAASGVGRVVEGYAGADVEPSEVGWREGALPVIFLATDAGFHNSGVEPSYPGASWTETVNALNDKSIRVYGLQAGGTIDDVASIVTETDGANFTLSSNSAEVVAAIQEALESASIGVKVALKKIGDFASLVKDINPEFYEDVFPGETLTFDVTFSRALFKDDAAEHVFSFRLDVEAEDVAIIQEIPVTVNIK